MNNIVNRRRVVQGDTPVDLRSLIPNYNPIIEAQALNSKYYILGIKTTSADYTVNIGYRVNFSNISNLKCDNSTTGCTNSYAGTVAKVVIATPGIHFITFTLSPLTDQSGAGRHINILHNLFYVRLASNASINLNNQQFSNGDETSPINTNWGKYKWNVIDVLDSNFVSAVKQNKSNTYGNADVIRVPKGTKSVYVANGTSSTITNKMVEVNIKLES